MPVSNTEAIFNGLFGLFNILAFVVGIIFFSVMGYFLIKYREKPSSPDPGDTPSLDRVPAHRGHLRSVVILLLLSSILLGFLIVPSLTQIDILLNPPPPSCNGCDINVIGHQFYWQFTYTQNSTRSDRDILRVPVNQTVVLHISSADVFHDFGIIQFKIKTDAIPGRTNVIWFKPYQVGNFTIQCYELCGPGHSNMKATLIVMQQTIFQEWYTGA
jgi:cytochrome c oxidase subunit 2